MEGEENSLSNNTIDEIFFSIIDTLCGRFVGLTPFEVLNAPTSQVFEVWTDTIINDRKDKDKKENNNADETRERVTSKTATWH